MRPDARMPVCSPHQNIHMPKKPTRAERIAAEQEQAARVRAEREARVAPFDAVIDAYVERYSDANLWYPGAGYVWPSLRYMMRTFIRTYVMDHGVLPTGEHRIIVPHRYQGGTHRFAWDEPAPPAGSLRHP